ncbi:uncharacterized protein LOC144101139 [Amblyomma americanum]
MLLRVVAAVVLIFHGAQSGQSSLNYFMDNLLRSAPKDVFPLRDADFEVDVQNDTVLEFYPFQLVNGTAMRFRRRVQRIGDCRTARSGGANVITCPLSFAGLTVSYTVESETPSVASRRVHFFVYDGQGQMEVAATPGRRTQMTAFGLQFLNVTMQKMGSVLVHPDVDEIFAKKASENVERTLWEALVDSYAAMMRGVVGGIRTPPVIS